MYYDSEAVYIISQTDAQAKIVAIDACIDALLTTVLTAMGTADTKEYVLNDGQTVIKKIYTDPKEVVLTVSILRMLRQQYINDINPRMMRLLGAKNLFVKRHF